MCVSVSVSNHRICVCVHLPGPVLVLSATAPLFLQSPCVSSGHLRPWGRERDTHTHNVGLCVVMSGRSKLPFNLLVKSYLVNRLFCMSSNMVVRVFTTSASGTVCFSPVSRLTTTHWFCFMSLGPTSRRIGTPCTDTVQPY